MLISRKFSGGVNGLSVFKNSPVAFSSTEDSLGGTRSNAQIKFDNSDLLYNVLSVKRVLFSKPFEHLGERQIKLNSDIGLKIQNNDCIKLLCDEYELDYIFNINRPGRTYSENDALSVIGGDLSVNILDGLGSPTELLVSQIDRDGGLVKGLEIKNRGRYFTPPAEDVEIYGGTGEGLKLKLKYRKTESTESHEKIVKRVDVKDNQTILTLDYSLSPGTKTGQISFEKWEIVLSQPYQNESQTNIQYKIFSEFTPNYSIPLTIKNNSDFDLIYNQSLNKMDQIIKSLEDRIQKLESK